MSRYNFTDLIKRHSKPFTLISRSEGLFIGGRYQNGSESKIERSGAIIPLSERKIYQSGGTYTTKDKHLYTFTPIESPLKDTQVLYKGNLYNIEEERDWSDYSDAYAYVLRWVNRFDKLQTN